MKKEMIDINKDSTVEFALFKKFTEFLYDLEIKNIRDELKLDFNKKYNDEATETNIYYFYVGLKLLNGLRLGPTKNYFNEKASFAPITKDRFIFFCEKFISVFDCLSSEDKETYKNINAAFIQWRNDLYKKHKRILNTTEDMIAGYSLKENHSPKQEQKYTGKRALYYYLGNSNTYDDQKHETIQQIEKFVYNFYHSIQEQEFKDAWNLLSVGYKRFYDLDYQIFKLSLLDELPKFIYYEIYEIIQLDEFLFQCQVGYSIRKDFNLYGIHTDDIECFFDLKIGEINTFIKLLNGFKKKLEKAKFHSIDKIELNALFEKYGLSKIWNKHKPNDWFNNEHLNEIEMQIYRLSICTCKLINGEWKIINIRDVYPNASEFEILPVQYW